jgi:hypothetical protein
MSFWIWKFSHIYPLVITSYSWPETNQTLVSFPWILLFSNISVTFTLIFSNISKNISSSSFSHFFRFLILFFPLKLTLFIIYLPNIFYFIFIIDHINKFFLSFLLNNLFLKLPSTILVLFSGMKDYINIFIEFLCYNI